MSTTPSTLADLGSFLSTASAGAAAWYNGISEGTPVVTSPAQGAANQLAINQQAQLALNAQNPALAGLLANPAILIIIGILGLALILYLYKK